MSKDTIYRQAAIDAVSEACFELRGMFGRCEDALKALPSAQPGIVRCKDCKWKQGHECVRFADIRPYPDDFCSRAERRQE